MPDPFHSYTSDWCCVEFWAKFAPHQFQRFAIDSATVTVPRGALELVPRLMKMANTMPELMVLQGKETLLLNLSQSTPMFPELGWEGAISTRTGMPCRPP
ncbi:hypothetical protein P7K49_026208, partial [Saguinus oedipus]